MRHTRFTAALLSLLTAFTGCSIKGNDNPSGDDSKPEFLEITNLQGGGYAVVSVSPFDGSKDTLVVDHPFGNLIVMSTSYIGFLDAIGCDSVITGVSGLDYVCDSSVQKRASEGLVFDIGYDASPDYERIASLKPDLLLTYTVSAAKSQFLSKLESLGIRVFLVNEHLERQPLARAAYVRLFGALTGNMPSADSVLAEVSEKYSEIKTGVSGTPRKVLVNIPYNDQWFIPDEGNYLSNLMKDAGGIVLGAQSGRPTSSCISLEKAYSLSKEADCWLNVGWCRTLPQLLSVNPLFDDFLSSIEGNARERGFPCGSVVWNDNKRVSAKGGNDFWESGVVHPELVLRDLAGIFNPSQASDTTVYYRPLTKLP